MSGWSLPQLLAGLHNDIENRLAIARKSFGHPVTKGDASERVWLELLKTYLPHRYQAETAHAVDSAGVFSQQIDIVIFDRQYSPLIFRFEGQLIVPAESIYAVFEAKQTINAAQVAYAQEKVASVRALHRTSLPIPHAGGTYDPRPLTPILGGLLTFESDWTPPLGKPLEEALQNGDPAGRLDLGCIAAHGAYALDPSGALILSPQGKPAAAFLLELIARLQAVATVPMIDIRAYARWLAQ
jgi:hypothetical protein